MTFEEIQETIQGMLSIQRELQNSQLRFAESLAESKQETLSLRSSITELRESITELRQLSQSHERRIEQLVGYSITGETDRLDVVQRLQNLERRVNRLEERSP